MVGGGRPLLPEILGQPAPIGGKSPILNLYLLVVPQLMHPAARSLCNSWATC